MLSLSSLTVWVLSGNEDNWERGLNEGVWGVTEKLKSEWEKLEKNDDLIFYCSKPISGIIGHAKARNKFKQDKPLWREEVKQNRVIWPYRFDFETVYVLPRTEWKRRAVKIQLGRRVIRGMSMIKNPTLSEQIFSKLFEEWGYSATEQRSFDMERVPEHARIKNLLIELGKLSGYIVEQEYPFSDIKERLDVVWRRVVASVPTFVFEVQIGGSMHQALTKLKHAYDVWNSNIYLVVKDDDYDRAIQYVKGAFHEIRSQLRIVKVSKILELYEIQRKDYLLNSEVGFR